MAATRFAIGEPGTAYSTDTEAHPYEPVYLIPAAASNGNLTFGQALKLIALAAREQEPAKSGSHWASGYMTLAKEKKWLDKDVELDANITRVQFCQIAAKAAQVNDQPDKNPFTDTKDKDVLALYKAEVISGMTETTFEPDSLLTRAQISKIIWAMLSI